MEVIRRVALGFLAAALVGCGAKEPMASDVKATDPYAGLSGEQKVDAIRKDPKLLAGEKANKISEAQKAAGLPVTGQ